MNIISYYFFFFNDTATTEIYTLSLHDALPISLAVDDGHGVLERQLLEVHRRQLVHAVFGEIAARLGVDQLDRKSTRLNSSHLVISYAVFCLKKKKNKQERAVIRQAQL